MREALAEILHGVRLVSVEDLEGIALAAHERAGPLEHPDPRKLARANDVDVIEAPHLARRGLYLLGVVYYRPCRDERRQGWTVYHELAHALLDGRAHCHVDVQWLALLLAVPRTWLAPTLRRLGRHGCERRLLAEHRHAPRQLLRLRVELFLVMAEAA